MEQQREQRMLPTFYENYRAALRDDCKAIEPTRGWAKIVGKMLFPELDADTAGRKLDDCTNPNRRDRLSDEHERMVMRLARERRGFSAALDFICDDTDFERPKPRDRKDEALELISRAERLVSEQRHVGDRLERLLSSPAALALVSTKKTV